MQFKHNYQGAWSHALIFLTDCAVLVRLAFCETKLHWHLDSCQAIFSVCVELHAMLS